MTYGRLDQSRQAGHLADLLEMNFEQRGRRLRSGIGICGLNDAAELVEVDVVEGLDDRFRERGRCLLPELET